MQYYYLDGLDKKGPYTKEELKGRNVSSETLVFSEGMESWKPIKDIPELNDFINVKKLGEIENGNSVNNSSLNGEPHPFPDGASTEPKPDKIRIPSAVFLFLSYAVCVGLSYLIVSQQRQKDRENMDRKIDAVFANKDAITDYELDGTDGQLYDVYQTSLFGIGENDIVRTSKRTLAMKPASNSYDQDKYATYYANQQKQWSLFKDLVQYYESTVFTGFDVLRLERDGSNFRITKSWSGDMAYKVPASRHVEGYSSLFYTSPGYDVPTYRPPVRTCYEEAVKYLTIEKEDKSYLAGAFNKISSFTDLETHFFEISQRFPKYTRLVNKIHVQMADKSEGDVIDNAKITDVTSATDANVFTNQWIVWYKSITNTYSVEEKQGILNKLWIIYSLIGAGLASIIFLGLKYRKRIAIK